MSSGTLLASRGPPQNNTSTNPTSQSNSALIGQLPAGLGGTANLSSQQILKGGNAQKPLSMSPNTVYNSHRGTPPAMPAQTPQTAFNSFQMAPRPQSTAPRYPNQNGGFDSLPLNDSEFPSLANVRQSPASHQHAAFASQFGSTMMSQNLFNAKDIRINYASLMRTVETASYGQQPVFQSEDFPALPGASAQNGSNGRSQQMPDSVVNLQNSTSQNSNLEADSLLNGTTENGRISHGIQTDPNGYVTNIPPGMLTDQYGIAGMLSFLRAIDKDPAITSMALGYDLNNLGLNLNSTERNLYLTFGGPWAEAPCRIQDLDVKVPDEYLTNGIIRDKLPQIKMNKLSEDVLFYMFYNCPGQVYQLAAACELFSRDWRFHKEEKVWLTRAAYLGVREQTTEYEKGQFNVFDPVQWRKIPREMTLEYKMLEPKPQGQGSSASLLGVNSNPPPSGSAAPGAPQMAPFSK
uniref:NOT2_3_5 domain-containing protein n=2 Tax=Bursaphelenchus xylophilus TaxID=6326 RepID=A0A1I7SWC8_BURXY